MALEQDRKDGFCRFRDGAAGAEDPHDTRFVEDSVVLLRDDPAGNDQDVRPPEGVKLITPPETLVVIASDSRYSDSAGSSSPRFSNSSARSLRLVATSRWTPP